MEKKKIHFYFFNSDISLINNFPIIKFHMPIENTQIEGSVSQILYIGPSFYFMKSRKIVMKK